MKIPFAILCLCAVCSALGFDSEAWLAKRASLDDDAARLKVAYTNCVANLLMPAKNVAVPIEHFADGAVKSTVTAGEAQFFLQSGYVWCKDVCVKQFEKSGATNVLAYVRADTCVIDRNTRCGLAVGNVELRYSQTTVRGDEIYFSFAEEFVKILSNAQIESADLKFEGVRL